MTLDFWVHSLENSKYTSVAFAHIFIFTPTRPAHTYALLLHLCKTSHAHTHMLSSSVQHNSCICMCTGAAGVSTCCQLTSVNKAHNIESIFVVYSYHSKPRTMNYVCSIITISGAFTLWLLPTEVHNRVAFVPTDDGLQNGPGQHRNSQGKPPIVSDAKKKSTLQKSFDILWNTNFLSCRKLKKRIVDHVCALRS